jgi:hypothetical protein
MDISNKSQNFSRKKNGGAKGIITPLATILLLYHIKRLPPERMEA